MSETILVLLSGAAGAAVIKLLDNLLQHFLDRHAKRQDCEAKEETETEKRIARLEGATMSMLLDRIQYLCKVYIRDGSVDADDLRRLHIMHDHYHEEGGNGDLDKLMTRVDHLPLN